MNIAAVDLNLLVAFHAMLEHRNVTRAGEAIGLSQPAMSSALRRLRLLLEDPLFIRAGLEMKPTPRALQLSAAVRQVVQMVQSEILQPAQFEALLAETEGFEPSMRLYTPYSLSRGAPSATRSRFQHSKIISGLV
jgi:DNA-binding transcriptional LysR family regulator